MTDGEGGSGYENDITAIYNTYKKENFFMISIGLGEDYNRNEIDKITRLGNGGTNLVIFNDAKFFATKDVSNPNHLNGVFEEIQKFSN